MKHRVIYQVHFEAVVDTDEYDGCLEDAMSDIVIPEDNKSQYLSNSFEIIDYNPV
jgi:hypothetical protein